jgi:D-alanine-D-alanine ligase
MSGIAASTPAPAGPRAPAADARLRVAVLAGGRSAEHDVSLASAESIREGLRDAGHETLLVEITREGEWLHEGAPLMLSPGTGLLGADVAFPALHGPFGEDGTVQGALEVLGVPYVGAGVSTSAVCMDKVLFKDLMGGAGVPQVAHAGVGHERFEHSPAAVLAELAALGLPVFVKPARMGSSLGIAKVAERGELEGALEHAFEHDELVIVEASAPGLEIECAVLGTPHDPCVSAPGQILVEGEWYDFHAKYTPGAMRLVIPAPISATAAERVRSLAREVFARVRCQGLARVDFFVDGESVLVNELNTMPGFTPTSVYAKLMESAGVPYPRLVDRLCRLALERHRAARARQPS